jgi:hypothetical protein
LSLQPVWAARVPSGYLLRPAFGMGEVRIAAQRERGKKRAGRGANNHSKRGKAR